MARSLGVQSTLAKPFDLKTVRTTVDAAFAARSNAPLPDPVATPAVPVIGGAQERLSALVAFSRRLFGHTDPAAIVESTCHAARDILLAQCAQLVIVGRRRAASRMHGQRSGERAGRSAARHAHVSRSVAVVGAGRLRAVSDVAGRCGAERRGRSRAISFPCSACRSLRSVITTVTCASSIASACRASPTRIWRSRVRSRHRSRSRTRTRVATRRCAARSHDAPKSKTKCAS